MWCNLERAALLTFKRHYGRVPKLTTQGKGYKKLDVFDYFSENSLLKKLLTIEQMKI